MSKFLFHLHVPIEKKERSPEEVTGFQVHSALIICVFYTLTLVGGRQQKQVEQNADKPQIWLYFLLVFKFNGPQPTHL